MKVFSGSSNPPLATAIAKQLNVDLGTTHLSSFPNDELSVRVGATDKEAIVVQSFSRPVNSHIIEYILLVDALKRNGAQEIFSVIPWYGYSKQDKVFLAGEPLSAKVMAKLIQTTSTTKVITTDLHNPSISGYFDIPVINTSAYPLFVNHIQDHFNNADSPINLDNSIVVAPDAGAVKASTKVAHALNLPIAYINKTRNVHTGEVTIVGMDRSIDNQTCIIFDDMIATGSTIIKTAAYLKNQGAKHIIVCATHHLYIPGVQEQIAASAVDQLIISDSIYTEDDIASENITKISLAKALAQAV